MLPRLVLQGLLLLSMLFSSFPSPAQAVGDVTDDVFYHFMPIAWRDSDNDTYRFGDFDGMTASLDYLADSLGVTAVWMNPIHPSPAYHGYQHGRGDEVNPWFGPESDFVDFIQAAHVRGIKVFIDFVAYGISHDSIWFQDAYGNPASVYDTWLAFENGSNTTYLGGQYTSWNGNTVGSIHWDHRDPNPTSLVTQWAQKWITLGLDGYRLDHVWETYPNGPDGYGYHIDTFWAPWRDALRATDPDVYVFAEQADWQSHGAELLVGMDAAFTKPFEFAARDALAGEWAAPLQSEMASTLAALGAAPAAGTFLATIGNHDVDRLASAIGSSFEKGKAAAAVLLTQPFPPVIYHGDEIGMLGVKTMSHGGDAADIPMREPFKWNAVAGPPMTNYHVLNSAAYTNAFSQDNDGRSVEEQFGVSGSLLEAYRTLIATRKGSVALRRGGYTLVPNSSPAVWAFVRDDTAQQVLVTINVGGAAAADVLDLSGFTIAGGSTTPTDLLAGATLPVLTDANKGAYPVTLPAYGYLVLEASLIPDPPPVTTVDGVAIPGDFGSGQLFATQDNATGLGDNLGELNQLFLRTQNEDLHVGLTGNLVPDTWGLCFLLDTKAGGQNVLDLSGASPPPAGPDLLTGLVLDAGFAPDHLVFANTYGGTIYVDQYELLTAGGTNKTYRGQGTVGDGDGELLGGLDPEGMEVAIDNANTLGVTDADASGAATATSGIEMSLPYGYFDIPSGSSTLQLAAFLLLPDGTVSNQWLPGLGGGVGLLGIAPDLTAVPGLQVVQVSLPQEPTGVEPAHVGARLGLSFANPARAFSRLRFSIPTGGRVTLAIYDVRGRLVQTVVDANRGAGEHVATWTGESLDGRDVASGVYFVRLSQGAQVRTERMVYLR